MQKLHRFDLTGAAERTRIYGAHTAVCDELRDFGFGVRIVACDKNVQGLTSHLSRMKRACQRRVERLDDFRSVRNRLRYIFGGG